MKKLYWVLATVVLGFVLSGCASVENRTPGDPLEPMNRAVYKFNDTLDKAILKPVATGYKAITPDFMRQSVTNVFSNMSDVWSTVNAGFQLKGEKFLQGFFRVATNTIFGMGGLFDVATALNLPSPQEDFGQTLGYWGVKTGPYLVLPFFGPSNVRDGVGLVADLYMHPLVFVGKDKIGNTTRWGLATLGVINTRANLLGAEEAAQHSMFDPYIFFRDAYMQRRQNLVYDGDPLLDSEFEFEDDEL